MDNNLIGAQITKFRKAAGLTQEELGRAAGVSTQAVSRWECGGTPDVALMPAIADKLGVTIDALFGREGGVVEDIDPAGELMTVRFDDRTATYVSDMLGELELAYAVTVHKSQGSEYRAVVLVALPAAPALMVRGVLYTGVTRARELLVVVGDDGALGRMAANDKQQRRYSGLRWRLRQGGGACAAGPVVGPQA